MASVKELAQAYANRIKTANLANKDSEILSIAKEIDGLTSGSTSITKELKLQIAEEVLTIIRPAFGMAKGADISMQLEMGQKIKEYLNSQGLK